MTEAGGHEQEHGAINDLGPPPRRASLLPPHAFQGESQTEFMELVDTLGADRASIRRRVFATGCGTGRASDEYGDEERDVTRLLILLLATWIPLLLLSCATGRIRPLDPSVALTLEPGEGLLILQVDTDVPIAGIELSGDTVASGVLAGHHVWLVRAAAGPYRWTALRFTSPAGRRRAHRFESNDEFRFEVQPGSVNYGGALVVRSASGYVEARSRNHVAMAIRMLRDRDAELVARLPLRYVGLSEDGFLDYYNRERVAVFENRP